MSDWETNLLKLAYDQYLQTGNPEYNLFSHNGDDVVNNSNIVDFLAENGYIKVISDGSLCHTFEITQKGIDYINHLT